MNNWFIIMHMLGAVQGLFLAAILLSRQRGSVANRILAVLMLALAVDLAMAVYHATGLDEAFPYLIGIDFPLAFLYGPLIYLYAKTLIRRARMFRNQDRWHFLPFVLLVLLLIPFYLQSGMEKWAFLHAPASGPWAQVLGIVNHAKLVYALIYIGITLMLLKRHRRRIRDTYSSIEHINLIWLRDLMIGIVILASIAVVFYILRLRIAGPVMGLDPTTEYDDYTLLGTALLVYAIGFMGLRQPEIFDHPRDVKVEREPALQQDASPGLPLRSAEPPAVRIEKVQGEAEKPQYVKSGMDPETARRYKEELLDLMNTEKPYRRGDLMLQDLSDALSISPHNLTEVINTQLGQNFYDFVNGFRVREVQQRLADPQYAHLTLLAIGIDAGFNSKSSFNAVFKKHTKMTPSQFRAQTRKEA